MYFSYKLLCFVRKVYPVHELAKSKMESQLNICDYSSEERQARIQNINDFAHVVFSIDL